MREINVKRFLYHEQNNYVNDEQINRCLAVLSGEGGGGISSISDAIEAHQIKLAISKAPDLFRDRFDNGQLMSAQTLFSAACRYCTSELETNGIAKVYDQVELQYSKVIWQFFDACGAWKLIRADDFENFLMSHLGCMDAILQRKGLVARFEGEVKAALIANPRIAAEIIVNHLAVESSHRESLYLPTSLEDSEIDGIMINYVSDEFANPNYLAALAKWPTGLSGQYQPSAEVRVRASRRHDELMDKMFSNGAGFQFGTGVSIAMDQDACRGLERDGHNLLYSFSGKWLETFTDPATILNNLIYIFDFVDLNGLMRAPARRHEEDTFLSLIGFRVKGAYRITLGSRMRMDLTFLETEAYASFLESNGACLERALEWFYNEYVESEFGITGFSLALPTSGASWLDRCKDVGPEIERALKSYLLFAKYGKVDDAYFPFVSVKSFSQFPALEGKKYIIAGPEFERWGFFLFSDQCMLSYLHKDELSESCFFEMIRKHSVARGCYAEWLQGTIDGLINLGLISEEEGGGRLLPTARAVCLKSIWERDAFPLRQLGDEERELVESMAGDGLLDFCDNLFAPSEADYLEYMFNNASFSNSLGLRNWHDHASFVVNDPWADWIKKDYYKLLSLLVNITLKINEELMHKIGWGGDVDWVDWPYYDENVNVLAEELA